MNAPTSAHFGDTVIGVASPLGVDATRTKASRHRGSPVQAMATLVHANALASDHPAMLIALYWHSLYEHKFGCAREAASRALFAGTRALGPENPVRGAGLEAVRQQRESGTNDEPLGRPHADHGPMATIPAHTTGVEHHG